MQSNLFKMIFVCAMYILPCQGLCAEKWQDSAYLMQAFIEVALKNEYEAGAMPVRKWQKPVNVHVTHKVGQHALHTTLVSMHLQHLATITNLSINLVEDAQSANVNLVFTDQAHWRADVEKLMGKAAANRIEGAVCLAGFNHNKQGEMLNAWVVIPVDQATMHRKLVSCIVEELTQIMGLPNDSEKVYPSIFNDKTPDDLLTGLDGLLLKMLYHPMVKNGMKEPQVRPVLQQIIKDWQLDNTIKDAEKDIRKGALYPLLGF